MQYYKQLDTLRAIAAVGVINLHWLNGVYPSLFGLSQNFDWGYGKYGVQLFFVLSGFLITEILMKQFAERSQWSKVLKTFFIRRILRLVPIYYLFLILLLLLKDQFVIDNLIWFITYTANYQFYLSGGLVDVWSNHLWTLSIEEQFYIIFPFILLIFKTKRRLYLLPLFFILTALIFKLNIEYEHKYSFLLWAQIDSLGIGVLLAIIKNRIIPIYDFLTSISGKIIMLLFLVFSILTYQNLSSDIFSNLIFNICLMLFLGLLVVNTVKGFSGWIGRLLELKAFNHLGKISYGLYLYHKVIPLILLIIMNRFNIHFNNVFSYFLINFTMLVIVSNLSWYIIEKPILNLKDKFNY
jgi:peptidoglycan/LPS O-acetylase OafA/YrhL